MVSHTGLRAFLKLENDIPEDKICGAGLNGPQTLVVLSAKRCAVTQSQISLATGVRDLRKMESEEKEDAEEGDSFGKETGKRTYERGLESRMYRCRAGSFSARWRVIVSATLFLAEQSQGVCELHIPFVFSKFKTGRKTTASNVKDFI